MPIDATLLRPPSEGGNPAEVVRWQRLRRLGLGTENAAASSSPSSDASDAVHSPSTTSEGEIVDAIDEEEAIDSLVKAIQECDSDRRSALSELNASRHRLNELRRRMRPMKQKKDETNDSSEGTATAKGGQSGSLSMDVEATREEIRRLTKEAIPKLTLRVSWLERRMKDVLVPKLGNVVDTAPFVVRETHQKNRPDVGDHIACEADEVKAGSAPSAVPQTLSQTLPPPDSNTKSGADAEAVVMDPLFCVGGYETLTTANGGGGSNADGGSEGPRAMLTGFGASIADALPRYAASFLSERRRRQTEGEGKGRFSGSGSGVGEYIPLRCPATMVLDSNLAHNVVGCSTGRSSPIDEGGNLASTTASSSSSSSSRASCRICEAAAAAAAAADCAPTSACTIDTPSYAAMAALHADKSYTDARLPLRYLCTTSVGGGTAALPASGIVDGPSKVRRKRKDEENKPKQERKETKDPFPQYAHPTDRVSVFALTSPTLASSRSVQDDTARSIIEFHASLLLPQSSAGRYVLPNRPASMFEEHNNSTGYVKNGSSSAEEEDDARAILKNENLSSLVRARAVDVRDLDPNECRRVVVEGYVPSLARYVELGRVSNVTDFVTRAFRTRCGVSSGVGIGKGGGGGFGGRRRCGEAVEYVHTVHGTLCDVRVSLGWLAENNAVRLLGAASSPGGMGGDGGVDGCGANKIDSGVAGGEGLALPLRLAQFVQHAEGVDLPSSSASDAHHDPSFLLIPYQRRLAASKKGGITVRELGSLAASASPRLVWPEESCAQYLSTEGAGCATIQADGAPKNRIYGSNRLPTESATNYFVLDRRPTPEEIEAEALCSPHNFLPFWTIN